MLLLKLRCDIGRETHDARIWRWADRARYFAAVAIAATGVLFLVCV